ncbi:MAG: nucleoid occlusion factor SlmA, partial [Halomonas sp.]|nr:nucleoid occlusion factor SlmA [Halomonas sp.]NGO90928.1 nucleoid occlusion factor SlmA [Halomonas sp.]
YVRSDFKRLPTEYWEDQWALLSSQLLQPSPQLA